MSGWRGPLLAMLVAGLLSGAGAIIAMPRVIMNTAIERLSSASGLNKMSYGKLATPENQPVVRPSPDLAYSACPYDLSEGPLRFTMSPLLNRYNSLSIFDGRTDVIFVRNEQQMGQRPLHVVVALPGQAVPPGFEVVRTTEKRGIALIRLLLKEPAELAGFEAVRRFNFCQQIRTVRAK